MKITETYKALAGKSILMVDDEEVVAEVIKEVVGPVVGSLDTAYDGEQAFTKIMEKDYDFILMDIQMPRMNGVEFYNSILEHKPHLRDRIVFITGDTESETTRSFIKRTRCPSLDKPFIIKELLELMAGRGAGTRH